MKVIAPKNNATQNVYLEHVVQDGWNDLHVYYIENAIMWRRIAILAIVSLTLICLISMYFINQDKHKTLVFEKDSVGNITMLGMATQTFNIDNKMIAHQLANFIIALREVPLDVSLKQRNITLVHQMIDPKLIQLIDKMFINQYTNNHQLTVNITQLKPISDGKSWIISWQEQSWNANHEEQWLRHYSSVITFIQLDNINPQIQLANPIGLFITYIHPVEDINKL